MLGQFKTCLLVAFALAVAWPATPAGAQDDDTTALAAGDPDFAVQGEYAGQLQTGEGPHDFGAQVLARGEHRFHIVVYPGGLPGAGWDQTTKHEADGATENGVTRFQGDEGSAELSAGKLTIRDADGQALGVLERVQRSSPTLGQAPPEGAVVLFDGSSADAFEGGRLTEDGLLMQGCTSKHLFGDCVLHLEFRLPYMPTASGQGRSNSGAYLQGRYEVQILDSFGLSGEHNECGGVYSIKKPDVNMCLPPLVWQTYDIEYVAARFDGEQKTSAARITVRHNGVLIHEDVALDHATTAAPLGEGPTDGPLYLQDHGNPLRFRNIWLLERAE